MLLKVPLIVAIELRSAGAIMGPIATGNASSTKLSKTEKFESSRSILSSIIVYNSKTFTKTFEIDFDYIQSCQYLISSHKNYTITNLADHLEKVSHNTINRYLKNVDLGTEVLWKNVKKEIVATTDGYLIFDDTVIKKISSQKIELVRRQYSGNEHRIVRGIGVVNCLYFNPKIERFWIIDYRIYNPESDEKSKIDM